MNSRGKAHIERLQQPSIYKQISRAFNAQLKAQILAHRQGIPDIPRLQDAVDTCEALLSTQIETERRAREAPASASSLHVDILDRINRAISQYLKETP